MFPVRSLFFSFCVGLFLRLHQNGVLGNSYCPSWCSLQPVCKIDQWWYFNICDSIFSELRDGSRQTACVNSCWRAGVRLSFRFHDAPHDGEPPAWYQGEWNGNSGQTVDFWSVSFLQYDWYRVVCFFLGGVSVVCECALCRGVVSRWGWALDFW